MKRSCSSDDGLGSRSLGFAVNIERTSLNPLDFCTYEGEGSCENGIERVIVVMKCDQTTRRVTVIALRIVQTKETLSLEF
jgi:hypothetical protein